MKQKITVTIAGHDYTLVAGEEEHYVRKVAAYVDQQLREVLSQARISQLDGAVLAAMNIADQYHKAQENAENLHQRIKDELEESARLKLELSECKREIFKLQRK